MSIALFKFKTLPFSFKHLYDKFIGQTKFVHLNSKFAIVFVTKKEAFERQSNWFDFEQYIFNRETVACLAMHTGKVYLSR